MFITIKKRVKAARLSIVITVLLTLLKLIAASLSNSVSIFSEFLHSLLDLISATLTFFTVKEAVKPADDNHPFGHGKLETLSSLFESLLLLGAAFLIFKEAWDHATHHEHIHNEPIAIGVLFISFILSFFVYQHNAHTAKEVSSNALATNAIHFFADVLSALTVFIGLIVVYFTGWYWLDQVLGCMVAIYICWLAIKQIIPAVQELIDNKLPEEEIYEITKQINHFQPEFITFHTLRTRKSGRNRHIDFHLVVCRNLPVALAHDLCDKIEHKIESLYAFTSVNIHIEPCKKAAIQCPSCVFLVH